MSRPVNSLPHGALLRQQAAIHGERICVIVDDETLTYAELLSRATALARGMYARGIRKGDRIGVFMPNCVEFFVVHFAIQLIGAITVTINARYKSHELKYAVGFSDIRLLFTTDRIDEHVNFGDLLWETLPDLSEGRSNGRLRLASAPRLENIILVGNIERAPFVSLESFT